jgi:hypothetical protein
MSSSLIVDFSFTAALVGGAATKGEARDAEQEEGQIAWLRNVGSAR